MLLGPRDFPNFKREIISDISDGTEVVKKEFKTLFLIKCIGDLTVLVMYLVILWKTLTKNLFKMLAIKVGSDVISPGGSLSLLTTLMLLDFLISIIYLISEHSCFIFFAILLKVVIVIARFACFQGSCNLISKNSA